MVLIDAISIVDDSPKKSSAQMCIDIIDSYRGEGSTLLVSWLVYSELKDEHPEIFEYAQDRNIQIVQVPC